MKGLISVLMLVGTVASAEVSVIGRTYPIAERDAIEEIEEKAATVDWGGALEKDSSKWGAMKGHSVPDGQEDRERFYIPFYEVEQAVTDQNGAVVYPVGFVVNPLEYVTLPGRILVIRQGQEGWAKARMKWTDMVLVSEGAIDEISVALNKNVFRLGAQEKKRLDVQVVPMILEQEKTRFRIHEFRWVEESK